MYTEHEQSGGGDGQPEYMKIKINVLAIPMMHFSGGCDACRDASREAANKIITAAMETAMKAFAVLMASGRGNCDIEFFSPEECREKLITTSGLTKEQVAKLEGGIHVNG